MSFRFPTRCPRRAWLLLLPILVACLVDRTALHPRVAGLKPTFPVVTRLEGGEGAEPGGIVTVLASITAWAPGEVVEWDLLLPPGLTPVDGPQRWSGILERGETRTLALSFRVADGAPRELTATARIPGRPRATSGATLLIDAGASDAPAALRLARDGGELIQYQGEVTAP